MFTNRLFCLLLVALFVVTACVPQGELASPITPTLKPTITPIIEPTATAQPTIPAIDPESNFPTGKFIKVGTTNYRLMFNEDGTFSVFSGSDNFVRGTYKVKGNVFTETSNNGGCKTNVDFTYTFDGTNLTFNYVGNPDDDLSCDGRHDDFNNVTYILSK